RDLLRLALYRASLARQLEIERDEIGGDGQPHRDLAVTAVERDRAATHDLARHHGTIAQDGHGLALEMAEPRHRRHRRAAVLQAAIDEPGIGDGGEHAVDHALDIAPG